MSISPGEATEWAPTEAALVDQLLVIENGALHVELLPGLGARLHRLRVFGHDVLRTPADPMEHARDPFRWGGYVMAPWANRIPQHPTRIGSSVVSVPSNSEDGTVLHGQVYASSWTVRPDGSLSIRGGGDGWPWEYEATLRVEIDGSTLRIAQTLTNLSDQPMPAGLGWHPWFRRPIEVRVDATRVLVSNVDPDSEIVPVAGDFDLRASGPLAPDLDATWLDIGDPAAELRWPDLGIRASLRANSDGGLCIVAASPSTIDAVAIEPQTHAPQGLRRLVHGEPHGLVMLAGGASLHLNTEITFART